MLRVAHYLFMVALGFAFAIANVEAGLLQPTTTNMGGKIILCVLATVFAALFSRIWNDIADIHIDRICNRERPLVTTEISLISYKKISLIAFIIAMICALQINWQACIIVTATMLIYYFYSMPPIRFKRILFFSKLAISVNSLLAVVLGYFLLANCFAYFPTILVFIFMIGFTTAANLIDIKDQIGDAANGILTLPVLFGEKNTKLIVSLGFLSIYFGFYFLIIKPPVSYIIFLCMATIVVLHALHQKNYQEQKVFVAFLLSAAVSILWILLLHLKLNVV